MATFARCWFGAGVAPETTIDKVFDWGMGLSVKRCGVDAIDQCRSTPSEMPKNQGQAIIVLYPHNINEKHLLLEFPLLRFVSLAILPIRHNWMAHMR